MDSMLSSLMATDLAEVRRRGLRKGTFSCWECKRRKMKCVFDRHANDAVCNGCRRRNTRCIGQEIPEELVPHAKGSQTVAPTDLSTKMDGLPATPVSIGAEATPQASEYAEVRQSSSNANSY